MLKIVMLKIVMNKFDKLRLGFLIAIRDEYALKTKENDDALIVFRKWLVDKGENHITQILDGDNDKNISEENLRLAKACIVWRGDRLKKRQEQGFFAKTDAEKKLIAFVINLWEKGEKIMRKGYAGKTLSDEDFQVLNLYRILAETHILGVPVWEYEINKESVKNNPYRVAGSEISLPNLPNLIDVLNLPSYSDAQPAPSLNLVSNEAHKDLIPLLNTFDRNKLMKIADEDVRTTLREAPASRLNRTQLNFKNIYKYDNNSEISSNEKPTCLIVTSAADCFWSRCSSDAEYFKRSYGDKLNFLWINIRLWDFMIQIDNPFANQPEKELYGSIQTLEERGRTTKAFYLRQPWLSLSCKLDLPSDICANLFQCPGGEAQVILVDKNDKLIWRTTEEWPDWFNKRPSAPWITDYVSWADEVEQQIQALLKTNKSKNKQQTFPALEKEENNVADNYFKAYLLPSRVVSVDTINKIIQIKGRPVARFSVMPHQPDTEDECNPMLDIILHYKENGLLFRKKSFTIEELQTDDILSGWIVREETGPWICFSVNVTKKVIDKQSKQIRNREAIIHCFGDFLSYDCETGNFEIRIKNLKIKTLGEAFIKDNSEAYNLPYDAQVYLNDFAKKENSLQIKINENSLLRRNGIPCQPKDFQFKDKVRIEFVYEENNNEYSLRLLRGKN